LKIIENVPEAKDIAEEMQEDIRDIVANDIERHRERQSDSIEKRKNKQLIVELSDLRDKLDTIIDVKKNIYSPVDIKASGRK
jgi:hypothetical protein